jgi:hypothetical protein
MRSSHHTQSQHMIKAALLISCSVMALAGVAGCRPKPVAEEKASATPPQQAAQAIAPPAPKASTPPSEAPRDVKPDPREEAPKQIETAAAGKASTIAGGWVNAGGACDSGASVQFNADGTYMSEGEKGTWALDGKTLTVTTSSTLDEDRVAPNGPEQSTGDIGEKAVLTLLNVNDTSASVILSNGTNARWTRCSQ